ncbi:MAG: glycoside hydrolase family 17 [Magnetococcales bacterium]|nr:glycoside hydrolase family 17 [Magnetococcales bacterium]
MRVLPTALGWLFCCVVAALFWRYVGQSVDLPDVPPGRYHCLSYAPFRDGQVPYNPDLSIPRWQIEEDLAQLAPLTECVRTYSATRGLEAVVDVAAKQGLHVLLGTWLGPEQETNAKQIAATLAVARPEVVQGIVVGNEVLLRKELSADQLIDNLHQMRAGTALPITYADVWESWLKNPQVADHVDFLTIHILPYWEDEPVGVPQALVHVQEILQKMRAAFPGRTILLGETGWPSAGRSRQQAVPGVVEQARFIREFIAMTTRQAVPYNLIEAFDQPWKSFQEGTVGSHWGLFNAARHVKFSVTGPVSALPNWPVPWALGMLFSLFFLVRYGRQPLAFGRLVSLSATGFLGGGVAFWRWQQVADASQNNWDWALGLAGLGLLLMATLMVAAVLANLSGTWLTAMPWDMAALRQVLVRRRRLRAEEQAGFYAGLLQAATLFSATVTALSLVMDGRYRDFASALYILPALLLWSRWLLLGLQTQSRMEVWLGILLVGCAVAGTWVELPVNREAMVWHGVLVLLALPLLPYRRLRSPLNRQD